MTASPSRPGWLPLAFAVFGGLWFLLVRHLSVHWSVNSQYSFGWLVPFLGAYLLFRRWSDRPAAGDDSQKVWMLIAVVALSVLPVWMVEQPNPDWRLVSWVFAGQVVGLTLCAAYLMGGWPWVKHFAFPLGFILAAIPWPTDLELIVIQTLTGAVSRSTVEALNFANIPALQRGNVIEVAAGLLGIDEACSGVRSFQATLMASLFLGELFRFRVWPRIGLVVAGTVIALACNIGRAFFLGWKAAHDGIDAVGRFHDPAGFTILTACFALVWALAAWLAPHRTLPPASTALPRPIPVRPLAFLAGWLVLVLGGTEIWYRLHEGGEKIRWDFAWPASRPDFREVSISEGATELLKYDEGRAAAWQEGGNVWNAFFFKWNAGPARSRILARTHRPDICLPAIGLKLDRDLGSITVKAGGIDIPFRAFTFSSRQQTVHVYFCVWQDRAKGVTAQDKRAGWNRIVGVESVLRGERNLGQQVLELVLVGYESEVEAEADLRARLPQFIRG
jgi:exosortase